MGAAYLNSFGSVFKSALGKVLMPARGCNRRQTLSPAPTQDVTGKRASKGNQYRTFNGELERTKSLQQQKITHRFLLFGWLSRFKDLQWGCRFRFFFDVEKREKRTKYFTSVCLTFSAALLASIWFLSKPGSKNRPVLCVWGVPRHSCTIRFASLLIVDGFYLEHHLKYHPAVNLCVYVFVYFVMKLGRAANLHQSRATALIDLRYAPRLGWPGEHKQKAVQKIRTTEVAPRGAGNIFPRTREEGGSILMTSITSWTTFTLARSRPLYGIVAFVKPLVTK